MMIKHYMKIAWRNLAKQKSLAFINVFGLSAGIACFLLFLLYAVNELNFDRFHKNADHIFRIYEWHEAMNGQDPLAVPGIPRPLGPALKKDFPDVVTSVRVEISYRPMLVRVNEKILELKISYADPEFFSLFSFPLLSGNQNTVLGENHNIVLTESRAKEFFGNENPVGKTLELKTDSNYEPFLISGIAADAPANSSLRFESLVSFHYLESLPSAKMMDDWNTYSNNQSFVLLQPGSNLVYNSARLQTFRQRYYPDEVKQFKDAGLSWKGGGPPVCYRLQPLLTMHTDPVVIDEQSANKKTIWLLLSIAAGVLLIACINFTTLAIGRSAGRSKEVGLRKVVGAARNQVIFQFLSEALLLSIFSTVCGLLLARLLLPFFNQLSGNSLTFSFSLYPELGWMLFALAIIVGLLAGSYPALVLSHFKPIEVLKSKIRVGGSNLFTRSLVTLQFAVSIVLILATVIILQQIRFMNSAYLGFDKENLVLIDASYANFKKIYPQFKQELTSHPEILGVTRADKGLGQGENFDMSIYSYHDKKIAAMFHSVDPDYITTLGMKLIAGRNFSANKPEDTVTSVIINEAMLSKLGWNSEEAVGKQITGFMGDLSPTVIGVVKNFNFRPLNEKIIPELIGPFLNKDLRKFFVRIRPGDPTRCISLIKDTWRRLVSDIPLRYNFMDEKIDAYYKSEHRWSSIIGWAGGISIFLACLGLFGLAALTAVNRTKEIGIRKVMGAGIQDIVLTLSKGYLLMVSLSIVIATPIAWWLMNKWLEGFAYRIQINAWIFLAVGMVAVLLAFATVVYQSIKAAIVNPVESLRSE